MTMIKISFSPAPSRARRRPRRRVAGRRGAGDWAARARGPVHRSREGPGCGPGGKARAPGEAGIAQRKEGKQRVFVAERGRRGRAELIATLILCPAAQPSPEPGVAARSRSRSPRWDETGATRAASTGGEAAPGAGDRRLQGAGAAPEPDLPLRLRDTLGSDGSLDASPQGAAERVLASHPRQHRHCGES
ncbi:hypothetical protein MC885_019763 [Smutsia gigantea]|nr:hypothetical protein MC885_019763 [Smutsia gigantea]